MSDVMKISAGAGDARKWMRERVVCKKATNEAIKPLRLPANGNTVEVQGVRFWKF